MGRVRADGAVMRGSWDIRRMVNGWGGRATLGGSSKCGFMFNYGTPVQQLETLRLWRDIKL